MYTWYLAWIPAIFPYDLWQLGGLFAAFVLMGLAEAVWTVGCLRVLVRGDWLAAVILQAGGLSVLPMAVFGRKALDLWFPRAWVGYHLPFVGSVFHRDVWWDADDAYAWLFTALALGIGGLGLAFLGGLSRPDMDREVPP